jgi:hypothetical protein
MSEKFQSTKQQNDKASDGKGALRQSQDEMQVDFSPQSVLATMIQRAQANPRLLSVVDVIQLQRTLGNRAVRQLLVPAAAASSRLIQTKKLPFHALIQRKPADINGTHELKYDDKGTFTNKGADRTRGLKRTVVINGQVKDGWVTPSEKIMGGHLFKSEFGGPDDETNVVPWTQNTENDFSGFEKLYKDTADKDAKNAASANNSFTAAVKTKATFIDRPDLEVSEEELNTAGWTLDDPERGERKAKFADVAERFSGIPTTLSVEVTGVTGGPLTFSRSQPALAPTYQRNNEAIKPAFGVPTRFRRNGTETRKFSTIPDWDAYKKAKAKKPEEIKLAKKLDHVVSHHPGDFGVTGNSVTKLQELEGKIHTFVFDMTNEQIPGTYMGIDVLHYVNNVSRLWACTTPAGELVAAFVLGVGQYGILTKRGTVG